jgi:hypothetical protein
VFSFHTTLGNGKETSAFAFLVNGLASFFEAADLLFISYVQILQLLA